MSFVQIGLSKVANQSIFCAISEGLAKFDLHTTNYGLFLSLSFNDAPIITNELCLDRVDLNFPKYAGLPENLYFVDLFGTDAPVFSGFNDRFLLIYGQ